MEGSLAFPLTQPTPEGRGILALVAVSLLVAVAVSPSSSRDFGSFEDLQRASVLVAAGSRRMTAKSVKHHTDAILGAMADSKSLDSDQRARILGMLMYYTGDHPEVATSLERRLKRFLGRHPGLSSLVFKNSKTGERNSYKKITRRGRRK